MSKTYHKENTTYIIKLRQIKLYLKSYSTYTDLISEAMQFQSDKPASEKIWSDVYDESKHTVIKRTERISTTYEEVVLNE